MAVVDREVAVSGRSTVSTICLAPPTFILNLHAGRVSLRSCVAQRGSCSGTRCEHSVKILPHLVPGHGARVRHSLGANVNTPIKYSPQNSGTVLVSMTWFRHFTRALKWACLHVFVSSEAI